MELTLSTADQRKSTLEMFLNTAKSYSKKDVQLSQFARLGGNNIVYYTLTPPPYKKENYMPIGHGYVFDSRIILFTDFLVYLTRWTPGKEHKQSFAKLFLKEVALGSVSEYLGDVTKGISFLVEGVAEHFIGSESVLGKEPELELGNPWSVILPLDDITACNLVKFGPLGFGSAMEIIANHRFEGLKQYYFHVIPDTEKWQRNIKTRLEKRKAGSV